MVSREEVRWAYIMLLEREPEAESAYETHMLHPDRQTLRAALLGSEEGLHHVRRELRGFVEQLPFEYNRPLTVHLHIEKTGGTYLYEAITRGLGGTAVSLPHMTHIQTYSLGELNQLDFASGHLTLGEALALPRSPKTILCIFREPHARLISFYRFHRAHPAWMRADPMVRLAQDHDPADFFAHPEVRASHRLFNAYVRILAGLPDEAEVWHPDRLAQATGRALREMAKLTVVGITEDMAGTLALVSGATGESVAEPAGRIHSTDAVSRSEGFALIPPVPLTETLRHAMRPLVEHDAIVYAAARQRFERDLAACRRSRKPRPPMRAPLAALPLGGFAGRIRAAWKS